MAGLTTDGETAMRHGLRAQATADVMAVRSPGHAKKSWLRRLLLEWAYDGEIRARMRELTKVSNRALF